VRNVDKQLVVKAVSSNDDDDNNDEGLGHAIIATDSYKINGKYYLLYRNISYYLYIPFHGVSLLLTEKNVQSDLFLAVYCRSKYLFCE
jgi:hypothetical protein